MMTRLPIPSKGTVALERLGGLKGGKARTVRLRAEQRRELARKASIRRIKEYESVYGRATAAFLVLLP
jgi:hypothetical protein